MSWISKGVSSGRAVAIILFRMHRTFCLVRDLSRRGGTLVVIVEHASVETERNMIQAYLARTGLQGVCQFRWSFLEVLLCMHSLIIWRC